MDYELPWSGEPFSAPILAFDTETCVYAPDGREYSLRREIPPLVLCTVSDGQRSAVIHPRQLGHFVDTHSRTMLVGHNIQFDYWVVLQELEARNLGADQVWTLLPDRGLMDDTMLLDFLVRLGSPNGHSDRGLRNLGLVAADYGMEADKESPYRLRFHELVGKDWSDPALRPWFDYAVQDAHVTWHVYARLSQRASEIARREGVDPELIRKHGLLTSKLQTRASIVLSQISRNGMSIDQGKVYGSLERINRRVGELVRELDHWEPKVFGTYKTRSKKKVKTQVFFPSLEPSGKSGIPSLSQKHLATLLAGAAESEGIDPALIPRTEKKGGMSLSADVWRNILPEHPFVQKWAELVDSSKVLQFLADLRGVESVHCKYTTIVRTGRTSCSDPNLQQMPREAWFRENFVSRSGMVFVIADYSAIELVTLASVLEHRGPSTLAQVLREGRKPHDYTASLMLGIPYEDMVAGVRQEKLCNQPGPYSKARQAAKAINFGVPGGLGPDKLVAYAKANYGVELSREKAVEFRNRLIKEVYPELEAYLADNGLAHIARNIQCPVKELESALDAPNVGWQISMWVEDVIARGGRTRRGAGKMLPLSFRTKVWRTLQKLNRNPALVPLLSSWESTSRNIHTLAGRCVTTLTGRVREEADYGSARNTPFQGLAADGAKAGLWKIQRAGLRIVHFVHDEIIVECPEERAEETKKEMVRLMQEGMREVLDCNLPVEVEATISHTWSK